MRGRGGVFTVKPASKDDLDIFLNLYADFYNELRLKQGCNPVEMAEYRGDAEMILESDKVFIGYLNGDAIAFIHVCNRNNVFWIEELYIAEPYRGMGLGRNLVGVVEDYVKAFDNAVYIMVLPQDRTAIKFWLKMGYNTLNTIELVKYLDKQNIRHRLIPLMGVPYKLLKWASEQYNELEKEYLKAVEAFFESGGTEEDYLKIVSNALKSKIAANTSKGS